MSLLRFLLLLLAALACAPIASAQTFPQLTGRVVDSANMLDAPQKAGLTAKLEALEKQSGRQLVVVTLPDLQGYDIQDYGYRLGRNWVIGQKGKNDGVLLIVAKSERKIGIETGYGAEAIVTDALSSRIIRNTISPRFKAGDFAGGIDAGVDQFAQLLTLPPEEAAKRAAEAEKAERTRGNDGASIGMVIFWIVIILFFVIPLARRFGGGGRSYRSGGSGPIILWGPSIGSGWSGDNSSSGSGWGGFGGNDSGGFSGGGGDFGGGGASGDW